MAGDDPKNISLVPTYLVDFLETLYGILHEFPDALRLVVQQFGARFVEMYEKYGKVELALLAIILSWVVDNIIQPPIDWAFTLFGYLADSTLRLFLGADRQLSYEFAGIFDGQSPSGGGPGACGQPPCLAAGSGGSDTASTVGVAELPLYFVDMAVAVFAGPAETFISGIRTFNQGVEAQVVDAGLAALPVAGLLASAEVGLFAYAGYLGLQTAAAYVGLGPITDAVSNAGSRLTGVIR